MAEKPATKYLTRQAKSLAQFVEIFTKYAEEWSTGRGGQTLYFHPWFRGHQNAGWSLLPKLYRPECEEFDEEDCRRDFKLKARAYMGAPLPQSEWEWLFLMQHHKLPTRLLDWTESALVALHFAIYQHPGTHSAAVWMIDPYALNRKIAGLGDYVHDEFSQGWGGRSGWPIMMIESSQARPWR